MLITPGLAKMLETPKTKSKPSTGNGIADYLVNAVTTPAPKPKAKKPLMATPGAKGPLQIHNEDTGAIFDTEVGKGIFRHELELANGIIFEFDATRKLSEKEQDAELADFMKSDEYKAQLQGIAAKQQARAKVPTRELGPVSPSRTFGRTPTPEEVAGLTTKQRLEQASKKINLNARRAGIIAPEADDRTELERTLVGDTAFQRPAGQAAQDLINSPVMKAISGAMGMYGEAVASPARLFGGNPEVAGKFIKSLTEGIVASPLQAIGNPAKYADENAYDAFDTKKPWEQRIGPAINIAGGLLGSGLGSLALRKAAQTLKRAPSESNLKKFADEYQKALPGPMYPPDYQGARTVFDMEPIGTPARLRNRSLSDPLALPARTPEPAPVAVQPKVEGISTDPITIAQAKKEYQGALAEYMRRAGITNPDDINPNHQAALLESVAAKHGVNPDGISSGWQGLRDLHANGMQSNIDDLAKSHGGDYDNLKEAQAARSKVLQDKWESEANTQEANAVEKALSEGRTVPQDALDRHPEIAKKYSQKTVGTQPKPVAAKPEAPAVVTKAAEPKVETPVERPVIESGLPKHAESAINTFGTGRSNYEKTALGDLERWYSGLGISGSAKKALAHAESFVDAGEGARKLKTFLRKKAKEEEAATLRIQRQSEVSTPKTSAEIAKDQLADYDQILANPNLSAGMRATIAEKRAGVQSRIDAATKTSPAPVTSAAPKASRTATIEKDGNGWAYQLDGKKSEPWAMTRQEIGEADIYWQRKHNNWPEYFPSHTEKAKYDAAHRKMVDNALKEGKPVPASVLADYPDLAAKYKPTPAAIPAPAVKPAEAKGETKAETHVVAPKTLAEQGRDARAQKSLNETQVRTKDGEILTLKEHVDKLMAEGGFPKIRESRKYVSEQWYKKEDKLKERLRSIERNDRWGDGGAEAKKIRDEIAAGNPKVDQYTMSKEGDDGWYVLSKAQYDYAVSKQPKGATIITNDGADIAKSRHIDISAKPPAPDKLDAAYEAAVKSTKRGTGNKNRQRGAAMDPAQAIIDYSVIAAWHIRNGARSAADILKKLIDETPQNEAWIRSNFSQIIAKSRDELKKYPKKANEAKVQTGTQRVAGEADAVAKGTVSANPSVPPKGPGAVQTPTARPATGVAGKTDATQPAGSPVSPGSSGKAEPTPPSKDSPAGSKPEATGLANQVQYREFAEGKISEVLSATGIKKNVAQAEGKKAVESGRINPDVLADEVASGKRTFTTDEVGAAMEGKRRKLVELNDIKAKLDELPGNPALLKLKEVKEAELDAYLAKIQKGKGSWSDVGRAFQEGTTIDYGNPAEVLAEARRIKPDHKIEGRVNKLTEELTEVRRKLADLEASMNNPETAAKVIQDVQKTRTGRATRSRTNIKQERAEIWGQISKVNAKMSSGIDPQLIPLYGKILRSYVQEGTVVAKDLIARINQEIKARGLAGNFDEQDLKDALNTQVRPLRGPLSDYEKHLRNQERRTTMRIRSLLSEQAPRGILSKADAGLRELSLFNVSSRVLDVAANTTKLATYLAQTPVRHAVNKALGTGIDVNYPNVFRILKGAKGRYKQEWLDTIHGLDPDTIAKYGKRPGYVTRMTGTTDIVLRDFYTNEVYDAYAHKLAKGDNQVYRKMMDQLQEDVSGPIPAEKAFEIRQAAHEHAIRMTFMSDNLPSKMLDGMTTLIKDPTARDAVVLIRNLFFRFSKVIGNVATDRVESAGVGLLTGGSKAVKLKLTKAGFTDAQARTVSDQIAKGFFGLGLTALGYYAYDNDLLRPEIVKSEQNAWLDWGDIAQLGGVMSPITLGSGLRAIEKSNSKKDLKEKMTRDLFFGLLFDQPLVSGSKRLSKVFEDPVQELAGVVTGNVVPGISRDYAAREDYAQNRVGYRKTRPTAKDKDKIQTRVENELKNRVPGLRAALPSGEKSRTKGTPNRIPYPFPPKK